MFIKKIKEIIKENKEIREDNINMDEKILEAKKEIAWLKMILNMNRYGSSDNILSIASRKIDEIEEILDK